MELVFTLRPDYEEGVSGLVQYGSGGETFNLSEDLDKNGTIRTEDAALQTALLHLHGESERIFTVTTSDGEPYEAHLTGTPVEEPDTTPAPDAPAEHGDSSSPYEGLTKDELLEEVSNRGLDASAKLKNAELIAALEANDAQGGTSSGSTDS